MNLASTFPLTSYKQMPAPAFGNQAHTRQTQSPAPVQFSGRWDDDDYGGGSGGIRGMLEGISSNVRSGKVTVGTIIRRGLMAAIIISGGIFGYNNFGIANNKPGTRSVVLKKYDPSGAFAIDPATKKCKVEGQGWVPLFFAQNYPFSISPQVVRLTVQPFTEDGIKIDGTGKSAEEGIDLRLSYSVDDKDKYAAICETLLQTVVGESSTNPAYNQFFSVQFESVPDPLMEQVFYTKIAPMISGAMNPITSRFKAMDIQQQREALEGLLKKGLTETLTDEYGHKRTVVHVEPLEKELAKIGIKLEQNGIQVATIDPPEVLVELNKERSTITIDRDNAAAEIPKLKAQQKENREKVIASKATEKEQVRGEVSQQKATEIGKRDKAKEDKQSAIATANGAAATRLATAKGQAKTTVLTAKNTATETRRDANVYYTQMEAEAQSRYAEAFTPLKAQAEALAAQGEQLTDELLEQARIEAATQAQTTLAGKLGSMLLSPGSGMTPGKVLQSIQPDTVTVHGGGK